MVGLPVAKLIQKLFSPGLFPPMTDVLFAAELIQAGFSTSFVSLTNNKEFKNALNSPGLKLVSAMDIMVDPVLDALANRTTPDPVLVGGYAFPPHLDSFSNIPGVSICCGPTGIREAEGVLPEILEKYKCGQTLPERFGRTTRFNMKDSANEPYMQSWFASTLREMYRWSPIVPALFSRGCNFGCDFCPTAREPYTHMDPSTFFQYLDTVGAGNYSKILALGDQNFTHPGNKVLKEVVAGMRKRKIKAIAEGTLSDELLNDQVILGLLAKVCTYFLVGVENVVSGTTGSVNKTKFAKEKLEYMVKETRRARLAVMASAVVGDEGTHPGYGAEAAEVFNKLGIAPVIHAYILRPGTAEWERYKSGDDGRKILNHISTERNMRTGVIHERADLSQHQAHLEFLTMMTILYSADNIRARFEKDWNECGPRYALKMYVLANAYRANSNEFRKMNPEIARTVDSNLSKKTIPSPLWSA